MHVTFSVLKNKISNKLVIDSFISVINQLKPNCVHVPTTRGLQQSQTGSKYTPMFFIRHLNKSPTEVTILAISPIKRASDFVIPQINKVLNSCFVLFNFPNWKSDISSSQTRLTVSFKGQFCPGGGGGNF